MRKNYNPASLRSDRVSGLLRNKCPISIGTRGRFRRNIQTEEQMKKLTYVAITRARERLFVGFMDSTDILQKIQKGKEN